MSDLSASDILCLLGNSSEDWAKSWRWLEERPQGRLIVVLEAESDGENHPRVTRYLIESPLQIELLARKIAWEAVLLNLEIIGGTGDLLSSFRGCLKRAHLTANLLLSDAADFGCFVIKQSIAKKDRPVRDGMKLAGAFRDIPAMIVGAGPSLKNALPYLPSFQEEVLIFAGGSALNALAIEPHFAASIDKEAPYRKFKQYPFAETPFCFQNRMSAENFSLIHGEPILFPDSHFSFLNGQDPFDGGWTVGSFLIAIATLMGCNPILLVGMDFCYDTAGEKYGDGAISLQETKGLIEIESAKGNKVLTQPDWLLAHQWIEEWAQLHSKTRFIDATGEGMGFSSSIQTASLSALQFAKRGHLRKEVHQAIQKLPFAPPMEWDKWQESLEGCGNKITSALQGNEEDMKQEMVYEKLLAPLWSIWSHVFERASGSSQLELHQLLFFQKVIEEHLHAIH